MAGEQIGAHDGEERICLLNHLAALSCRHRPERVAIGEMRKFAGWLLPGITGFQTVLSDLNAITTLNGFSRRLEAFLSALARAGDLSVHCNEMDVGLDTRRQA
jgi:hypothetical protein